VALFLLWLERGTFTTNFMFIKGIYMFNKVTKLLVTIALTGWMGVANATLIFDFSWDSSNGKISGEILGLMDNVGGQAASAVIVTEIAGTKVHLDFLDDSSYYEIFNNFDVSAGELSVVRFQSFSYSAGGDNIRFSGTFSSSLNLYISATDTNYGLSSSRTNTVFKNRVTVPEPDSIILVLLGLAGLSFARYRKQY
jgi:hypothetical protein